MFENLKYEINNNSIYSFNLSHEKKDTSKIIESNLIRLKNCLPKEKHISLNPNKILRVSRELFYLCNKFSETLIHLKYEHFKNLDFKISFRNYDCKIYYALNIEYSNESIEKFILELEEVNTNEKNILKRIYQDKLKRNDQFASLLPLGLLEVFRNIEFPFLYNYSNKFEKRIEFIFKIPN